MKLSIKVITADNEYVVDTNLFHIVQLERKFKIKASDLALGISMEQLGFLAHEASKSGGVTTPLQLDDFLKKLVAVEVVETESGNPTNGDQ